MILTSLTLALLLAKSATALPTRGITADRSTSRSTAITPACGDVEKRALGCRNIEERVRQFNRIQAELFASDADTSVVARRIRTAYGELFASAQKSGGVGKLPSADVKRLFDAAYAAQQITDDSAYVRDLQVDIDALEQKGVASQLDYIQLNQALLSSHMFAPARRLEQAHPAAATQRFHSLHGDVLVRVPMVSAPVFRDESHAMGSRPSQLVLRADGGELVRRSVAIRDSAQVIVILSPDCPFARRGIRDIETDPALNPLLRSHTIWLVPPDSTDFGSVAQWNRAHPREIMTIAYKRDEWPMLHRWDTPTFYFLANGKVVSEIVGWPPGGRKADVQTALQSIGLR